MHIQRSGVFVISALLLLTSCVSKKKYDELTGLKNRCCEEAMMLGKSKSDLEKALADSEKALAEMKAENENLEREGRRTAEDLEKCRTDMKDLASSSESKLKQTQNEARAALEALNNKEAALRKLEDELRLREARVAELEKILKDQKDAVSALKDRIAKALKGFDGSGLKVIEKNGRVYVSMDEKLLFESGKTDVSPRGREALAELAKVLGQEKDLSIMVEGHTDNVPLSGTGPIKDNWDLSVLRATSIVKIILQNPSVEPQRILPAGRGEFTPVSDNATKEGRALNRRTDIIITPRINELMDLLNGN
ncbi:MAG: OmpA family protein [Flavobacteriales bacterium]|nr:OmpA family protein [Flavobacteriales bacterium]